MCAEFALIGQPETMVPQNQKKTPVRPKDYLGEADDSTGHF